MSADRMVWPSVFKTTATLEKELLCPRPEWIGINEPFWEDLEALRNALAGVKSDANRPHWLVAATWHTDQGFNRELEAKGKFLGPYLVNTSPDYLEPTWRFLGFDVTDGAFISGLSNCGYNDGERETLAAEWGRDLNRYHLFGDLARALKFSALTNKRVVELAPFFVIGLWLIEASGNRVK